MKNMINTFQPEPKKYTFDIDKINTIEDVKLVIKGLMIVFGEDYPNLEELKPLLKEYKES